MYAIDLQKALRPENNNTPNAIVSRSKTALDRLDGRPLGDPANVVISEDRKTAFIVNHHGAVDNAEFLQHGGRGGIAVMNVKKMIDRKNDNTAAALERHIDTGHFGAVGLALLPDMFIVGNADVDLARKGAANAEVARVRVGTDVDTGPTGQTRPFIPSFTPNGEEIVVPNFRANNVSIVNLDLALAHHPGAEVARIPLTRKPDTRMAPCAPRGPRAPRSPPTAATRSSPAARAQPSSPAARCG